MRLLLTGSVEDTGQGKHRVKVPESGENIGSRGIIFSTIVEIKADFGNDAAPKESSRTGQKKCIAFL